MLTCSVLLGRQVYRPVPDPGLGAVTDIRKRIGVPVSLIAALKNRTPSREAIQKEPSNEPPPLPTKYLEKPLWDWYLGPRPLDTNQPLRRQPPLRLRGTSEDLEDTIAVSPVKDDNGNVNVQKERENVEYTGVENVEESPPSPNSLHPTIPPSPSSTPAPSKRKKHGTELESTPAADEEGVKKKKKSKPKRVSEIAEGGSEAATPSNESSSPKKKKARKSGAAKDVTSLDPVVDESNGSDKPKKKKQSRKSASQPQPAAEGEKVNGDMLAKGSSPQDVEHAQ